jgi:hypothetical protein
MKKIKVTKEGKIFLIWEREIQSGSYDEYSMQCSDQARPEFYSAMIALYKHVIDMCELPDSYLERITTKSVSFSYGGDTQIMGATISASMKLENSPAGLNLNTPHKACDSYNPEQPVEDPALLLSEECIEDLDTLTEEAEAYINGDRAQMNLFADDGGGDDADGSTKETS